MSVHVHLRDVDAAFGARAALKAVTLEVRPGAILSIIGESGSGKSTALRLIAGLERPKSGEIAFGDMVVASSKIFVPPDRRRVGFVFQDFALFPHMRAIDNVAFGLNQLSSAQRRETAQSWLDKVGLGSRARAFPHELSGGEQQRVALARALAIRPGLVLLDEPFSGLDPSLRAELRDVALSAIRDVGASAVFVTHDIEEALYVGDDLAILKAGRVLQSGKTGDVYDTPICVEAAAALGPINTWRGPCAAGIMQTPFGAIATRVEDGPATLVIRAEALRVREGHGATLIARQRIGALDLLRFDYAGATWKALAPREDNLSPGAQCGLALDPRGVFTYAADLVSG